MAKRYLWLASALLLAAPLHAAEVCVYAASGYLATGTQNCVKNSSHGAANEGYTSIDCTAAQRATFETYIPTGPGATFTATAYVESDDTGAGERCAVSVGLLSMVGHCLTPAGAATNDGAVCQTDSDCTGGRTCIGGVPDNVGVPFEGVPTVATRTFAADTRYVTTTSSSGQIQRYGDDGASAWTGRALDCGAGSCTGHAAKLDVQFNTNLNSFCTSSLTPNSCCTGSGTGTCDTTASDCQWWAICVETP